MKRFISLLTILFVLVAVAPQAQTYDLEPSYTVEHVFTVADVTVEIHTQAAATKAYILPYSASSPDIKSELKAMNLNFSIESRYLEELKYTKLQLYDFTSAHTFCLTDRLLC